MGKSIIFILVCFVLMITYCNYEEYRIKGLVDTLEIVNSEILELDRTGESKEIIEVLNNGSNEDIKRIMKGLINKVDLCEIEHYNNLGIAYLFKCKNNSRNKFFRTKEMYYLIKIINTKYEDEFLHYEQFMDYRIKLLKLENNWFLVKIIGES